MGIKNAEFGADFESVEKLQNICLLILALFAYLKAKRGQNG
jgi:hypothetical protein